jgi:hypothetical protein
MTRLLNQSGIALLAALAFGAVAHADGSAPPHVGNIWDGRDHEPNPSDVHRDERAAGVGQTPRQRTSADDDVESIYRQLMENEKQGEQ